MSVMIEQDLKEYLGQQFQQINQQFEKINQRLERIENDVTDLKIGQTRLEGELKRVESDLKGQINQVESGLKGKIELVEEKVNGLEKRFSFQEWINRGILICLIGADARRFSQVVWLGG